MKALYQSLKALYQSLKALYRALIVCAVAGLPALVHAELNAEVTPHVVDELDTVRLTIRASGTNLARRLDVEPLEEEFEVLTTQSSSQYRSVNGQVESWVEYQVLLRPKHAGEITIPPIRVGAESTRPLTLSVRGIAPELQAAIDRMVFFETELTRNPVYVQAQTVLERRLYYASGAQIYSDLPGTPEIPHAIVMPLGETSSTTSIRDGQRYGVIEQRFAIFPEQSGVLTIPAIAVTSSVRVQSGGRTRRSGVRIATEPMTLEVLPIPPEYPADQPWLPADELTLSDRWTPVDARIEVGDPLRRTLSARVIGNVSSVVPPLEPRFPDRSFRRYPEPPQLEDDAGPSTVRGVREQSYSVIPTAPGAIEIPATEIVWWDVTAEQVRVASTPGRTFWITGQPVDPPESAATGDTVAKPGSASADATAPPPPEVDVREQQVPWPGPDRRRALGWLLLSAVLAIALATWWSRRRPPSRRTSSRYAAWRALKRASREPDAANLRQALMEYLCVHYRASAATAARAFRRDGHGAVVDALNAARYRPGREATVGGEQVLEAVRELRRRGRRRSRDPLPALYD